MQNQQQQSSLFSDSRDGLNVLYSLATAHSTCFWPFLRRGFGRRVFGVNGVIGATMILMTAANSPSMMAYFWSWLGALLCHRARSLWAWGRGIRIHSLYQGWPWLAIKLPFLKNETRAKNVGEPFICLFVGALLLPVSYPLGCFIMVGFFSLLFVQGVQVQATTMRVMQMQDATIEQRQLVERVRNGEL